MNKLQKAQWMAKGFKAKNEAAKLSLQLADWELFSRTFGWFVFRKKYSVTDEQAELFRLGFVHEKEAR